MKALPVARLSSIVSAITSVVRDRFGFNRVWIGGGSAPALLDHLFGGNALRMRDFDLVMVAERPVDETLARQIGEAVDSPDLQFLPRYVYPRQRSRCGEQPWLAGWGVLWSAHGVEVDLSIFHDHTALELNGLLNIDRIRIPLPADVTFDDIAATMLSTGGAQRAIACGLPRILAADIRAGSTARRQSWRGMTSTPGRSSAPSASSAPASTNFTSSTSAPSSPIRFAPPSPTVANAATGSSGSAISSSFSTTIAPPSSSR